LTLSQKLEGQPFWNYFGDDCASSRAAAWPKNRIQQINGIQDLGIAMSGVVATDLCTECEFFYPSPQCHGNFPVVKHEKGNEITNSQPNVNFSDYLELRQNWDYLNIWWNDADFALILAHRLISDKPAQKCREIFQRLAILRLAEVTAVRSQKCGTSIRAGVATFAGGWVLTVVTLGAAAPVSVPVMLGGWGCAFTSGIIGGALQAGEQAREARRVSACKSLQTRFPRLSLLFAQ
jgi:hypothetical protein